MNDHPQRQNPAYGILQFLFFISLAALPLSAQAGTISLQAAPQLEISGGRAVGVLTLKNSGNQVAMRVFPRILIGTVSWVGEAAMIYPNQSKVWQVALNAQEKLSDHPLITTVSYTDANGFEFSNIQIFGQQRDDEVKLDILSNSRNSREFHISGYLTNLSEDSKEVVVKLLSPGEFEVVTPLSTVTLDGSAAVEFSLRGVGVIEGSQYVAYLLASWVEQGTTKYIWQPAILRIEPVKYGMSWMYAGVTGAVFILLFLIFRQNWR